VSDTALGIIRVALAEDHAVVRSGLCLLLSEEPDMEVVADTGTVAGACRIVAETPPDVLVLDLNLADGSSLEAIPELSARVPVVVLTMQESPAFARQALASGAKAYILKEAADEELKHAVRAVAAGEDYVSPALGARVSARPADRRPEELTPRELEVLRLIGLGHTNTEIAVALNLSTRTVESHRAHVQQKLRAGSRAELVRAALDRHLI
jgi:two-component system response regulator NreC